MATGLYWSWKSWRRLRAQQRPRWVEPPLAKIGVGAESSGRFSPFVLLVLTTTSAVEALEVLLVVAPVALTAPAWPAALGGILLALTLVSILAVLLHSPPAAVPDVSLRLGTGLAPRIG